MTDLASPVTIELNGLSVFAHHGVVAEERALGQRFEFDVTATMAHCEACHTNELDDTIAWEEIADLVVTVAREFRFTVMEALAEAVATELLAEFPLEIVRIRVRKVAPVMEHPVAHASISIERTRAHVHAGPVPVPTTTAEHVHGAVTNGAQ